MPEGPAGEKTEKPTPKRLREARQKGQIARSQDASAAIVLIFAGFILVWAGSYFMDRMQGIMQYIFVSYPYISLDNSRIVYLFYLGLKFFVVTILPFITILMVSGIVANVAQFGLVFSLQPLMPDMSRLNPFEGFKRLFSLRSLVEGIKNILKLVFIGLIVWSVLKNKIYLFVSFNNYNPYEYLITLSKIVMELFWKVASGILIIGIADYLYQKWDYIKRLMMTKQELKDEMKETLGDPLIKSRLKSLQRQILKKRMMEAVKTADVVVTNPTHFAVALKYDAEKMNAPQVVAKGADKLAEKIKEVARENDVPIIEDPPLARMLYKMVEVGDEIPYTLYKTVAEILAYVYKMKGRKL